jgi:basic membrane protein A and related proteins
LVGLVTDVGGRGDQSFNDSALRGLETWAANARFEKGKYVALTAAERTALVPPSLAALVTPVTVRPVVVQSKAQEDYQPNLQLLVDQGATLVIGVGFMLENAIENVAKQNPKSQFLLVDSRVLDASGAPIVLPNVHTISFREEEGSFLAGALAGKVAKNKVAFVGGMEVPLIKRFEMGFRAGVKATNPAAQVLIQYTGSFDNVSHGKQAGQDVVAKGAEVVFHAAGSDGVGVIAAVKEGKGAGKTVWAIGVDSDQQHLAPEAVLTSMVKRVDLAVWRVVQEAAQSRFSNGDRTLGLTEGGVELAPIRVEFAGKTEALAAVEALKAKVVSGALKVPSTQVEFDAFTP